MKAKKLFKKLFSGICFMMAVALGLISIIGTGGDDDIFEGCECSTGKKQGMLAYLNNARSEGRSCGDEYYSVAPPIEWNDKLGDAALKHSEDMSDNDFLGHVGSDDSEFWDRAEDFGYNGSPVGENVAEGYDSSEAVVKGWLESPGHCSNIMNPNATEFGAACKDCYWTLVMGRDSI